MTTKAINIVDGTYTKVVSSTSAGFLIQNTTGSFVSVLVMALGSTVGSITPALDNASIKLDNGFAIDRQTVGDGEIWVKSDVATSVLSVTGG